MWVISVKIILQTDFERKSWKKIHFCPEKKSLVAYNAGTNGQPLMKRLLGSNLSQKESDFGSSLGSKTGHYFFAFQSAGGPF